MRTRLGAGFVGIALVVVAAPVPAQTNSVVPQSPAFTYLALSPTDISHPTTARGLGAALATLVDPQGRFRQGFALDVAPWVWIPSISIPADEYARVGKYILANTTVSIGASGAEGPDGPTDIAAGVRTTFIDESDPMRDPTFRAELRDAIARCGADPEADVAQVRECAGGAIERLRTAWLGDGWNRASLSAALATGWRFPGSVTSAGAHSGWAAWVSGALPLGAPAQLVGQLSYEARNAVEATVTDRERLAGGARVNVGSSWVNGFAELAVAGALDEIAGEDVTWRWAGGVEFLAAQDLWLSTGFGSGFATAAEDRLVVIANIRWNVSPTPLLAP